MGIGRPDPAQRAGQPAPAGGAPRREPDGRGGGSRRHLAVLVGADRLIRTPRRAVPCRTGRTTGGRARCRADRDVAPAARSAPTGQAEGVEGGRGRPAGSPAGTGRWRSRSSRSGSADRSRRLEGDDRAAPPRRDLAARSRRDDDVSPSRRSGPAGRREGPLGERQPTDHGGAEKPRHSSSSSSRSRRSADAGRQGRRPRLGVRHQRPPRAAASNSRCAAAEIGRAPGPCRSGPRSLRPVPAGELSDRIRRHLSAGDDEAARGSFHQLLVVLGPHVAKEEGALFPMLRRSEDLTGHIGVLESEHAGLYDDVDALDDAPPHAWRDGVVRLLARPRRAHGQGGLRTVPGRDRHAGRRRLGRHGAVGAGPPRSRVRRLEPPTLRRGAKPSRPGERAGQRDGEQDDGLLGRGEAVPPVGDRRDLVRPSSSCPSPARRGTRPRITMRLAAPGLSCSSSSAPSRRAMSVCRRPSTGCGSVRAARPAFAVSRLQELAGQRVDVDRSRHARSVGGWWACKATFRARTVLSAGRRRHPPRRPGDSSSSSRRRRGGPPVTSPPRGKSLTQRRPVLGTAGNKTEPGIGVEKMAEPLQVLPRVLVGSLAVQFHEGGAGAVHQAVPPGRVEASARRVIDR